MKNKKHIVTPRLFSVNGKATPKHDNFLLIFNNKSECFKRFSEWEYFKKEATLIRVLPTTTGQDCYLDQRNNIIYKLYPKNEEIYFNDEGDEEELKVYIENIPSIIINNWEPEKPLLNKGYYIGSIDLWVELNIYQKQNIISKDEPDIIWKKSEQRLVATKNLLFEFKPKILSFSETIRQVKVYQEYTSSLGKSTSVVVTYSDISSFKEIFKGQGIKLIQIKEEE